MSAQAIAAGAQAVGTIVQGFGAFQGSRARAAALRAQARQARGDASMEAQMATDEAERAAAAAAVSGAASGGGFEGSFASVLDDLQQTGVFNARSAIWAGNMAANNANHEAGVARQEGNIALLSSVLGAGSSVAGQFAGQAERRKQAATRKRVYVKGYGR